MNQLIKSLPFLVLLGCSGASEDPSTTPPPPWGVPITGGTMKITKDGKHAVIADPDRDRILSFDFDKEAVTSELALSPGDEPGRIIEDNAGRIHVSLRGGGAVLTLTDAVHGTVAYRRAACPEPRGLAYDATGDVVHVACTSGELITFPAADGAAVRRLQLDRDLRDVIVQGNQLVVTRFRTAELLTLDASGAVVSRVAPPVVHRNDFGFGGGGFPPDATGVGSGGQVDAVAAVAWRTIALPDGRLLISHQRQLKAKLETDQPGGYGGGCGGGPDESAITIVSPGAGNTAFPVTPFARGALPVDVAVSPAGDQVAFATAGNKTIHVIPMTAMSMRDDDQCGEDFTGQATNTTFNDELGSPTSLGFRDNGDLVVFYPELPGLVIRHGSEAHTVTLPGEIGYDSGRGMFHQQTAVGIACASCHPEGRDDGLVWEFNTEGLRRTQNLSGHIMDRAPYHWRGDMTDLPTLMDDVFQKRMSGGAPTHSQKVSLGPWLNRLKAPAPAAVVDADAVARGAALFESDETKCASCHNGELYSNKLIVDVGTGGSFKVPSLLGLGARAPYMHTGCAATLTDRFGACGGGDLHGHTSQLSAAQIADLVAYLESL